MISKTQTLTGQEARSAILNGVNGLADPVTITLGAKGRNVLIATQDYKGDVYSRDIIHDGVKVSRAINLASEAENSAACVLREAAEKTVMEIGDGTTVTILLGQAIYQQAYNAIATGSDPVEIREGLEDARDTLIHNLSTYKIPITTQKEKEHIAYISCQDRELGTLIAGAVDRIGVDGIIRIEKSKNNKTEIEYQTGMQFDKGFGSRYFATTIEKGEEKAVLEYPYLLITDHSLTTLEPLTKLLQELFTRKAPLVIIAPSISGDAMRLLLQNKMTDALQCLAIAAPSFGENQVHLLEDLAILTGGKFINQQAGDILEDVTLKDLGKCDYINAGEDATLISGGAGKKKALDERIATIKKQLETEKDDFKIEKLKERLGKLTNGIAIIHVGGYTEIEMKERKERVDDAVHATQAAIRGGIVPGGEVIYLTLREVLGSSTPERILYKALEEPFNKLVTNGGLDAGVAREKLVNSALTNKGIDIRDGMIKNMITAGIIDPLLVIRSALYNSISVAIQLLLTEAIIIPEPKRPADKAIT